MTSETMTEPAHVVKTTLNFYFDPAHGGQTDFFPGTASSLRRKFNQTPVDIQDVRGHESEFNLDKQGFQLIEHESVEKDFKDDDQIKTLVYPETETLLKSMTGATRVHTFSHLVRRDNREAAEAIAADPSVPNTTYITASVPARFVHIDQSDAGAVSVLHDNFPGQVDEVAKLRQSRWAIINVWRPIKPITRDPLAVCDARSLSDADVFPVLATLPPKGSKTYENVSAGEGFETLGVMAGSGQRWYYASNMKPDEALLIKMFDTKMDGQTARRSPHSSFVDPATKHIQEPRESIEIRSFVFWEDQPL